MGGDPYVYGWKLFGFKSHGFAAVGKFFIPCHIVMFAFMTVYHNLSYDTWIFKLYFRVDLTMSIH